MELYPYHDLELKEIFTRTNSLSTTRLRLFSFFGTVDLTFISLSIELKSGLLLILGGCSLIFLLVFDSYVRRQLYALYARGLILEHKYCPNQFQGTIFSLAKVSLVESELKQLIMLFEKDPQQEAITKLLKGCHSSRFGILLPLGVMIVQILVGILMKLTNFI